MASGHSTVQQYRFVKFKLMRGRKQGDTEMILFNLKRKACHSWRIGKFSAG